MTPKEVMDYLGISRAQLSYYVRTGKIATKTIENGRYDYDEYSVQLIKEKGIRKRYKRPTDDSESVYTEPKTEGQTEEPKKKRKVNRKLTYTKQTEPVSKPPKEPAKPISNGDSDIEDINKMIEEVYQSNFAIFFMKQREIMSKIKQSQVTDEELQFIMMEIPINLFEVSEALQRFKSAYEVIKLKVKGRSKENSEDILSLKLMSIAYSSVISRVESEISFSKELIMSAKKIWSARRDTESSMPVALPDYEDFINGQQ